MSEQMIARRIALADPLILTSVWLAVTVGSVAAAWLSVTDLQPPIKVFGDALLILLICAICSWSWAVYALSAKARPNHVGQSLVQGIYLAPPLIAAIAVMAGWPTDNSPAGFCIMATLVAGFWWAALALEKATSGGVPVGIRRTLATMFLMYFSMIGVWVLRSKIKMVAT